MNNIQLFDEKFKILKHLLEENKHSFEDIKTLFKELEGLLFKEHCLKSYLTECEPFYCGFRYTNECKYLDELSVLFRLKEQYKF